LTIAPTKTGRASAAAIYSITITIFVLASSAQG
jgi:hypothetical protein